MKAPLGRMLGRAARYLFTVCIDSQHCQQIVDLVAACLVLSLSALHMCIHVCKGWQLTHWQCLGVVLYTSRRPLRGPSWTFLE